MNNINIQALKLTNTTNEDFIQFCKDYKKPINKASVRVNYFKGILEDRIVRYSSTNKIHLIKGED